MSNFLIVKVKRVDSAVALPQYKTTGAAGFDLHAGETVEIPARRWCDVKTGLIFEIPQGYEIQTRSRSSYALRGLIVMNQPGTVDSDFRGELRVNMYNASDQPQTITKGERFAQAVLNEVAQAAFMEVDEVTSTTRGTGGFGSTGSF